MVFLCGHTERLGEEVTACDCKKCQFYDDGRPRPAVIRVPDGPPLAPRHFNGSMIRWQGRLLMAYRDGWQGSNVHVAELLDDGTYRAVFDKTLDLARPAANYGREDPRLFVFGGRLHVSFVGVQGENWQNNGIVTNQLYARLTDDLQVERVLYPDYASRQSWEKNWSFFECDGGLYAVYAVNPHRVLRIDGDETEVATTPDSPRLPWGGGEARGGAPPVRVGDEFVHWFHGSVGQHEGRSYNVGVCAFEARPPFRVTRMTPEPLLWSDATTKPPDQYCPVLFPAGAVLEGGKWKVSCGIHDRWLEVHEWDAARVDAALAPAPAP